MLRRGDVPVLPPAYWHWFPQWFSPLIWLNLYLHGFLLSMFCHLIMEMFPSPEKLSVDDILCELRKKFKYNAACQIHSWDVFAVAATIVSWAAHTSTCLKAFYVHMPKCIFQEMCDVLILSSLNAFTSWHDSSHTCYPTALPTEDTAACWCQRWPQKFENKLQSEQKVY